VILDGRDASRVTHLLPDILRARIFAIACGYEDADDLDRLRFDPAFKLACGRLPDTGESRRADPGVCRLPTALPGSVPRCGAPLFAKRLERGRFVWPRAEQGMAVLTSAQLSMLLEGLQEYPRW
jgi:hypothetical protein